MMPVSEPVVLAPMIDPDAGDIVRAAAGDPQAFERLVDRHLGRVHRLAWRSLGNDADAQEIAQETFLRAFSQLPHWQPNRARFSTWLYRVAFNLCQDQLRRRRDWVPVEDLDLVDPAGQPDTQFARRQRWQRIEDAIAHLPQRQREALLLCHYEGQSTASAAAVLDVSVSALESLVARARRNLRAMLPDDAPTSHTSQHSEPEA